MFAPVQLPIAAILTLLMAISIVTTVLPVLNAAVATDETVLSTVECDIVIDRSGVRVADPNVRGSEVVFRCVEGQQQEPLEIVSAVFLVQKRIYDETIVDANLHHATADCPRCGRTQLTPTDGGRLVCRGCGAAVQVAPGRSAD